MDQRPQRSLTLDSDTTGPGRSSADWLGFVEPYLDPILFDPIRLPSARVIASRFPEGCMTVLEAPLGRGERGLDISFRIEDREAAHHLAGHLPEGPVARLLGDWQEAETPFPGVENLWLEIDLRPASPTALGHLPDDLLASPIVCFRSKAGAEPIDLVADLWPRLLGPAAENPVPSDPRGLGAVRRCLELCETLGGRLLYLFALLSRPGRPARLELVGLGPDAMVELVRELIDDRAGEQVRQAADLVGDADRHHLSLDLPTHLDPAADGPPWSPRIGVEASYERLPDREPGWGRLFDRLAEAGLCDEQKRQAVFAWPGQDGRRSADWPEGVPGHLARCLSHVKLVTLPERPPSAKVYLLYQYLKRKPSR